MKSEEKGISRRSSLKAASSIRISAVSTPSLSGTHSFHNHLLHFMVFFIITALPILSPSFSFLASLFAIPWDFLGSMSQGLGPATSPLNRARFHAMFGDGRLPLDHVREHHPIWYENLTGKKRPEPTPVEKGKQSVADEKLANP